MKWDENDLRTENGPLDTVKYKYNLHSNLSLIQVSYQLIWVELVETSFWTKLFSGLNFNSNSKNVQLELEMKSQKDKYSW